MARLSKDQWAEARAKWEGDERPGFEWLAGEIGVSRPAVSKMASTNGWVKGGAAKVTPANKVTQSVAAKVTQADQVTQKVTPAVAAPAKPAGKVKTPAPAAVDARAPQAAKPPKSAPPADTAPPEWEVMEKRPVGRPTEYREEFIGLMLDFFNIEVESVVDVESFDNEGKPITQKKVVVNTFPTLSRFASRLGITRETLHDWATAKNPDGSLRRPEFAYTYARAKDLQDALITEGGMAGRYEPRFASLAAKNLIGWKDQIEQTVETTVNTAVVETLNDTYAKGIESARQKKLEMIERRKQFATARE